MAKSAKETGNICDHLWHKNGLKMARKTAQMLYKNKASSKETCVNWKREGPLHRACNCCAYVILNYNNYNYKRKQKLLLLVLYRCEKIAFRRELFPGCHEHKGKTGCMKVLLAKKSDRIM